MEDICSNNKALFFPGGGEGPWYGPIPTNNWIVFLPIILQFSGELGKFNFWGSCQYQPGETTYNREFAKLWPSFNVEINYNTNLIWSRLFKSRFQMTSAISGLLTSFQVRRNSDDWKGQQNCPEQFLWNDLRFSRKGVHCVMNYNIAWQPRILLASQGTGTYLTAVSTRHHTALESPWSTSEHVLKGNSHVRPSPEASASAGLKYRSLFHRSEYRWPWYSPNLLTKCSIRSGGTCVVWYFINGAV